MPFFAVARIQTRVAQESRQEYTTMGKAWHLPYDYWRASWREGDAHPWEEVHPYMAVAWSLLAIVSLEDKRLEDGVRG